MLDIINKVPPHLRDHAKNLREIASEYGWYLAQVDELTYMIGFKRHDDPYARINVYITKMTFVTQIRHPKRGKGQLFRRHIHDEADIRAIFENPRVHTGVGYHYRRERNW